ncbi:MAG TPA: hypothetical protein PKK31_05215 [Elusimicrobiales bacterium]|nr:hypothetical protein [Elusimicrobiales bacterium]
MAKMIHGNALDFNNQSEKRFFELLQHSPATAAWTVIYSHKTVTGGERETDFVAMIPEIGLVAIELKAAELSYSSRVPGFKYARGGFISLRDVLVAAKKKERHLRELLLKRCGNVFSGEISVFLNVRQSDLRHLPDSPSLYIASDCKYQDIPALIAAKALEQKAAVTQAHRMSFVKWKEGDISAFARYLKGEFIEEEGNICRNYLENNWKANAEALGITYNMLSTMPRLLLRGPAGTGKTGLLLQRARELDRSNDTLVLCYNKLLAESLRSELSKCDRTDVWCLEDYLREVCGAPWNADEDIGPLMRDKLPAAALEKLRKKKPAYDVLLVDEFQDFMRQAWLDVLDSSLDGGLAAGKAWLFADFSVASMTENDVNPGDFLKKYGFKDELVNLRVNYRNASEIAAVVEYVAGSSNKRVLYDKTLNLCDLPIEVVTYADDEEQAVLVNNSVSDLMGEGYCYQPSDIAVLSAHRASESALGASLREDISFNSIHAVKGMEAKVVLVTDLHERTPLRPDPRVLLYLGASRAMFKLLFFVQKDFYQKFLKLTGLS